MKDPKGKTTVYTYDKSGRLIQATIGGYFKNYTYYGKEKDYKVQSASIVSVLSGGSSVSRTYDYEAGGNLIKHTLASPAGVFEKQFTYDSRGRLYSTSYINSGFKTKNVYDPNGFLRQITTNMTLGGAEKVLYEITSIDGEGHPTNFTRLDGLNSVNEYTNGLPTKYYTSGGIQSLEMSYNYSNGNLNFRQDNVSQTRESFNYDGADRLIQSVVEKLPAGGTPGLMHPAINVSYDAQFYGSFGKIVSKSDVGEYKYASAPRNALVSVTDPAAIISHETQNVLYNEYNKASLITENVGGIDFEERFWYDTDDLRVISEQKRGGVLARRRIYFGDYEEQYDYLTGSIKKLHYITGDNGTVGIVLQDASSGIFSNFGVYTDHLGSIVALTNEAGSVVGRQSFDPWGRKRNADTWDYSFPLTASASPDMPDWMIRGYTGHEMLPEYGLVNMNGRMYDPANGRMLSPDKYNQNEQNSQAYNRYSYCLNNPLKMVDPTGDQYYSPNDYYYSNALAYNVSGFYSGIPYNFSFASWNSQWSFSFLEESTYGYVTDKYLVTNTGSTNGWYLSGAIGDFAGSAGVNFTNNTVTKVLTSHVVNSKSYQVGEMSEAVGKIAGEMFHQFESQISDLTKVMISDAWNSCVARAIVADKLNFSIGGDLAAGVGVGIQPFNLTLLTRGHDPGLYLTPSYNITGGITAKAEGNINFSVGWYSGDPRNINSSMLSGVSHAGSLGAKVLAGGSIGGSWSPTGNGYSFFGLGGGLGYGTTFSVEYQRQVTFSVEPIWKF